MTKKKLTYSVIFSVISLIAIIVFNFFLPRLMPGDPLGFLMGGDDAALSAEEYAYYFHQMGLDKPVIVQFFNYLGELFSGKLGYSYVQGRDVSAVIFEKIPRTLQIAIPAWIITAVLALVFGMNAGYKKGRALDSSITLTMVIIDTVPTFLMAMLIIIIFSYEANLFPLGSLNSINPPENGFLFFMDRLWHLTLPILTIVIVSLPKKYILMRNLTAQTVNEKYVLYARARGVSHGSLLYRHVFPNIGQPFISMLGTSFGRTVSGSVIVELIFSIDGMGMLVNNAISALDFPMLRAALLIISAFIIISQLISDIICYLITPKQREVANE